MIHCLSIRATIVARVKRYHVLCPAALLAIFFGGGFSLLQAQSNYATPYAFTTLAGTAGTFGSSDGTGAAAQFQNAEGIAVDGSGNVYVADTNNQTIRKITPAGVVTTLAGSVGMQGSTDATGAAARFYNPYGVAVDNVGNVYVGDTYNGTIRKITAGGVVTTLAGSARQFGSTNGTGSAARFGEPRGIAVDGSGNVYVADTTNQLIREVTPGGVVTTLAGTAGVSGSTDGTRSAARFYEPTDVAVDGSGNVYVADFDNQAIRKLTPSGVVTTLAGGSFGSADGSGAAAQFSNPSGVAVDGSGNIYVADNANDLIRMITPGGVVTTLAGLAETSGSTDGVGSAALFTNPAYLAVDGSGNLYVNDTGNYTIRKGAVAPDAFGGTVVNGGALKYSSWFGYYTYSSYPLVYQYYLGYEYVFPTNGGVYLYDYTSGHFWYTQSSYFPYLYDFSLNSFLYYYEANTPHRHFYDSNTNQVITE